MILWIKFFVLYFLKYKMSVLVLHSLWACNTVWTSLQASAFAVYKTSKVKMLLTWTLFVQWGLQSLLSWTKPTLQSPCRRSSHPTQRAAVWQLAVPEMYSHLCLTTELRLVFTLLSCNIPTNFSCEVLLKLNGTKCFVQCNTIKMCKQIEQ